MNYTIETSDIIEFGNGITCQRTFHDDILKLEEWFKDGKKHRESETIAITIYRLGLCMVIVEM